MVRRSARLAARSAPLHQTAAARAMAIPEIVNMIVEYAFDVDHPIQLRLVNRLIKEATEEHLVSSINIQSLEHIRRWPPGSGGTYRLYQIPIQNTRLWSYVREAIVRPLEQLNSLTSIGNLRSLNIAADALEHLAENFALGKNVLLRGLVQLETRLGLPLRRKCTENAMRDFLTSLDALHTLHLALDDGFDASELADFRLVPLLGPVAPRITELLFLPASVDSFKSEHLREMLMLFSNLRHLFLCILKVGYVEGITRCIPQQIRQLTVECDGDALGEIIESLAEADWLPDLTEIPLLHGLAYYEEGEIVDETTMDLVAVANALQALHRRKDMQRSDDLDFRMWRLVDDDEIDV